LCVVYSLMTSSFPNYSLQINLTTDGDVTITNPFLFSCNYLNNTYPVQSFLYFPPTFKIPSLNEIKLTRDEYREYFMRPHLFRILANKEIKKPSFRKFTLSQALHRGYIRDNMDFINGLFFPPHQTIMIQGVSYTIRKSKIISGKQTRSDEPRYTMNLHLSVLQTARTNPQRLRRENCRDKEKRITSLTKELLPKTYQYTSKLKSALSSSRTESSLPKPTDISMNALPPFTSMPNAPLSPYSSTSTPYYNRYNPYAPYYNQLPYPTSQIYPTPPIPSVPPRYPYQTQQSNLPYPTYLHPAYRNPNRNQNINRRVSFN
jgi:hypothetical protein